MLWNGHTTQMNLESANKPGESVDKVQEKSF